MLNASSLSAADEPDVSAAPVVRASRGAPSRQADEIDLLSAEFEPGAVLREGRALVSSQPWASVSINGANLRGGWWRLEAEAKWIDAARGPEVALHFAGAEPVVARARPTGPMMRFSGGLCEIVLLPSPAPGRHEFQTLRLRRISGAELAAFMRGRIAALARDKSPVTRIVSAVRQLGSGRNFSARTAMAMAPVNAGIDPPPGAAAGERTLVHERIGDIAIVRRAGETLAPDAVAIVEAAFARQPHLRAIYGDLREAGVVHPRPQWDGERARWFDFAGTPVFFRGGESIDSAPWPRLKAIVESDGEASVMRIPLPLASTLSAFDATGVMPPPLPLRAAWPKVSVIVPTKARTDLLQKCLMGLGTLTGYPNLEVIVVDNGSKDPGFWAGAAVSHTALGLKRVADTGPFNFSRLINFGARHATGDVLLLLNDDVEPMETGWLHRMVSSVLEPDVGAVGARLVYPNGDIQHAGVVLGIGGVCGHLWRNLPRGEAARNPHIMLPGRRMAVTGACLAVRRDVFEGAGGLDEDAFPVTLNDIDFCLRLREAGLHTVYRGDAVLLHDESRSRGGDGHGAKRVRRHAEIAAFRERWKHLLADDPYASPAFDISTESGATRI